MRHGDVTGGRSCVIAMGKMGGREMTASSDLDLMLIYDSEPGTENSRGAKPLSVNQYFTRLTQRLINSITAPTGEGVLFEVDMRLRPSGSQGPVATSLGSFRDYQKNSAWTWEKLALTRARVVSGDADLAETISKAIAASLCARARCGRDPQGRSRHAPPDGEGAGLGRALGYQAGPRRIGRNRIHRPVSATHSCGAQNPEILDTNTHAALGKLAAAGFLDAGVAGELKEACLLYHRITQVLRLCVTGTYDPARSPAGLNQLVASAAGVPDIRAAQFPG